MPIRFPTICDYRQMRSPLEKGLLAGDYLTWAFIRYDELCLFKALHPALLARPFSKGLLARDYLTWAFIPLQRIVPLRGTLSCAFGARPFSKGLHAGIISHGLSCHCDELCLFEALHPAPLARPFSKGLRAGGIF